MLLEVLIKYWNLQFICKCFVFGDTHKILKKLSIGTFSYYMDSLIVLNVNKITELHELTKILYIYDFKLFINSDYRQKKKKKYTF